MIRPVLAGLAVACAAGATMSGPDRGGCEIPSAMATAGGQSPVDRAAAAPAGGDSGDDDRRVGEAGLWVFLQDEVPADGPAPTADAPLVVRWLTRGSGPGALAVESGDGTCHRVTTAAGRAHRAVVERPGVPPLTLRYGAADDPDDRHETTLFEEAPRRDPVRGRADTLLVVGDVHGAFDRLTRLLASAGLVDDDLGWTGGATHLVLTGDVVDRGPDVTRTLWFIYRLEREAARAGGRIHTLLGNHEIMVMTGDLRYVHPDEARIAQLHGLDYSRLLDVRRAVLGRWLASKPGLVDLGGALLAHGGAAPDFSHSTVEAYDDSLAAFMDEDLFYFWADTTRSFPLDSAAFVRRRDLFWDEASVFWYRGYVESDTLGDALGRVLDRLGARVHVVGHTPVPEITARYGGRLIAVDTAEPAAEAVLLVRDGEVWVPRCRYRSEGPPEPVGGDPAECPGG